LRIDIQVWRRLAFEYGADTRLGDRRRFTFGFDRRHVPFEFSRRTGQNAVAPNVGVEVWANRIVPPAPLRKS
jgi:hypothetical protein